MLRAVATDAHRVAIMDIPLPAGALDMPPVIVARKTILELYKLLENEPTEVQIGLSDRRIEVRMGNAVLSSRLIEGQYPDYQRVIPQANHRRVIVEAKALTAAVDRVGTFADDKVRVIKLSLERGVLSLSAISHEMGNANEDIEVDYDHDQPIELGFHPRYIIDAVSQIDEEEAELSFADERTPTIVRGVTDRSGLYILMPVLM